MAKERRGPKTIPGWAKQRWASPIWWGHDHIITLTLIYFINSIFYGTVLSSSWSNYVSRNTTNMFQSTVDMNTARLLFPTPHSATELSLQGGGYDRIVYRFPYRTTSCPSLIQQAWDQTGAGPLKIPNHVRGKIRWEKNMRMLYWYTLHKQ